MPGPSRGRRGTSRQGPAARRLRSSVSHAKSPRRTSRGREKGVSVTFTVVATIVAALVTGAFTVAGSAIAYFSSVAEREAEDERHLDDVVREVCVDSLASEDQLVISLKDISYDNFMRRNGGLPIEHLQELGKQLSQSNDEEYRLRLVGSAEMRDALDAFDSHIIAWHNRLALIERATDTQFDYDELSTYVDEAFSRLQAIETACRSGINSNTRELIE